MEKYNEQGTPYRNRKTSENRNNNLREEQKTKRWTFQSASRCRIRASL